MKKKLFGLLLAIFAVNTAFCNDQAESVVKLTREEREYLKQFYMYQYYKDETYFERLDDLQVNYLFNLVSRHIQILENKIAPNLEVLSL